MKLIFSIWLVLLGCVSGAQESGEQKNDSTIGFITGPFLPSSISGVKEIMEVAGARLGTAIRFGTFEGEVWAANGSGVSYKSYIANYRVNLPAFDLPVHATVGIHVDDYRKANAQTGGGGGWQFGGGAEAKVAYPLLARADFEYRFGPGQSLTVLFSLALAF